MMKKFYTLLFVLVGLVVNAQNVSIPDINFKLKLIANGVDTNSDGIIQQTEALATTSLNLDNTFIQNFIGLSTFTNLVSFSYDNSGYSNYISNTTTVPINFSNFNLLQSVTIFPYYTNQSNSVQVINCPLLISLKLNRIPISNITIQNCPNIKQLHLINDGISSFDTSAYPLLEDLNLSFNENLENLNLQILPNLKVVNVSKTELTALDVSSNLLLEELYLDEVGYWDYIGGNYTLIQTIQEVNLQNNLSLKRFSAKSCKLLNGIDFSGLTNLEYVCFNENPYFYNQNEAFIATVNFTGCINLKEVYLNYCHFSNTSLDFSNRQQLLTLKLLNNYGTYNLQNLNLSNCTSLNQLALPTGLLNLNLENCHIQNQLDYQNYDISIPKLNSLNLSGCTGLELVLVNNQQLTSLDLSSCGNLQNVNCDNNNLEYISFKNNTNETKSFLNNPNLQYICADLAEQQAVQYIINVYELWDTCVVGDYCSFNPNGNYNAISGTIKLDAENNGCDASDDSFKFLRLNLNDGTNSGSTFSNFDGTYTFYGNNGSYTLAPQLENPNYFNISPTTVTVDFPTQASPFLQDFCITPNGVHHDLEVTVIPLGVARPGFDASYRLVYKNKGNQLENPTLTYAFDDNVMDFLTASVAPTSQSLGMLTWNLGTLAPFQSGNIVVSFNLNSPSETPALNSGDILNYTATINPTATDDTPTDNVFTLNQEVVNSFDPNDKTCLEGETINPSMIGDFVHYQIRFENTGTYPAQNVVVKDMIDTTKFDISTLQIISISHSCYTRITDNKVEFIFENINLPFDDATNDGYVVFKIKTLPSLTVNSTISNTAEIYFDYNFPIITNTATSTYQVLANPNFDFANEFTLYPNPVKNVLNINAKNRLEIQSIEIYNTLGQLVIAKPNFNQTIDVSNLKTGTYFVKVTTEKGSGSVKFIKE
jgi:hypothetical protein